MKNIKLTLLFLVLIGLIGLWSCGPEDPESDLTIAVEVDLKYPRVDDKVTVTLSVNSTEFNLVEIKVKGVATDSNGTVVTVLNETIVATELTYQGNVSFTVPSSLKTGAEILIEVNATDENETTQKGSTKATVAEYMSIFRPNAELGHRYGVLPSAYNLVDAIEVVDGGAATRDIIDQSEQDNVLSQTFRSSPTANSSFANLGSDFDISTISDQEAATIFNNNNPGSVINVVKGTKFLARLRDGSDWAVVHIKLIEPDYERPGFPSDNKGRYFFDIYKTGKP